MTLETTPEGLEILTPPECQRLLSAAGIGRLAMPGVGAPDVRPVNFVIDDNAIVVRTSEGRILESARKGAAVSLEIDDIDRVEHTGWSVIVTGTMRERPNDESTRALPLRAWGSGQKDRFVSISLESVSGRRIPPGRGNR